ncbi:MAG: flagellar export chaperone FliS [Bryobacteraceae bacterium]
MNPLDAYQDNRDNEILNARPLELVVILYRAAIASIEGARRHLAAGAIRERSDAISKASAILSELAQSLDHEKGESIAKNLTELYDYLQRLIIRANIEQIEPPLIEAGKLLDTLLEGWLASIELAAPKSAYESTYDEEHNPIVCSF